MEHRPCRDGISHEFLNNVTIMKHLYYLISFLIIVTACTKDPEVMTGNILGIVTESRNGTSPLSGVNVNITSNGMSTTTGNTGQFSFRDLEPNTYTLHFMKEGFVANTRSVTVIAGQDTNCDILLEAEQKDADIQITPSSLNFGTTQSEMSVTITNKGKAETEWSLEFGNNNWITASPLSGRIANNKTQSIVFSVDRKKLPETKSVVINLSAFGNSFPISISCSEKNAKSEMKIDPTTLDFSDTSSELPLTIENKGEAELEWTLSGLSESCLSVSETKGKVAPGGKGIVQVKLNRQIMPEIMNATFIISDGIREEAITAKGNKTKAMMVVSPSLLDFGEDKSELSFNITNAGNAELSWMIQDLSESCLSLSATSGKIQAQKTVTITMKLNRQTMPSILNTIFMITDGNKEETVTVNGSKGSETADLVAPSGLYTYYKFDGSFNDATENEIHGFGNNNPTFVTGVTSDSKAVKFNRTNNSSFVVSKPIIDSRKMTIAFWGKDFEDGNLFYMLSSIQNTPIFTLSMSNGSLKFIVTRYDNVYQYSNTGTFVHPSLTDGKWHHIALASDFEDTTFSTITTILYVDGQAVDAITESANHFSENGGGQSSYDTGIKFVMGGSIKLSNSVTLNGTNMSFDNFRVYDTRKLSASEIKSIYDAKQ